LRSWAFARDARNLLLLFSIVSIATSCSKTPTVDPGAHPQGDQRDSLSNTLTDLDFVPPPRAGYELSFLVYDQFFSRRIEPIAIFRHLAAPNDTTPTAGMVYDEVVAYRWNMDSKTFDERAILPVFPVKRVSVHDVNHDGLKDLVLYVEFEPWQGMSIIGSDSLHRELVVRYSSDTSQPLMLRAQDSTVALIMFDSLATGVFEGFVPAIPRRFYRLSGDRYAERAFDPTWSVFVQHDRDSTHQAYLFQRQNLLERRMSIKPSHLSFTRALIAESLLDTNWEQAVSRVDSDLAALDGKLTGEEREVLTALRNLPIAAPYVGWTAQRSEESATIGLNALNDILLGHNPQNILAALRNVEVAVLAPRLWEQITLAVVKATSERAVLVELQRFLAQLISTNKVSAREMAGILRAQASVDFRLGAWQEAKGLFTRSLSFDSTSEGARKARLMLEKY